MDPTKGSQGAQLLRSYLKYVASGGVDLDGAEAKAPLNAFERTVKRHLERAGLQVIPQYGTSGYRIDFAVPHPDDPGRMLLGIEADGASYHSSPTARDRDRLRQQVLERLGWRFHRIWSTDWFNNPERETAKVLEAVEHARRNPVRNPETRPFPASKTNSLPRAPEARRGPRPPVPRGRLITDYRHEQLVAVARWILSDGLLRTEDELLSELMQELGFKKRGKRIVAALSAAIQAAMATSRASR